MKKMLAWLLVLVLVLSLGGTALAAEEDTVWGSYTLAGMKTDNEEIDQETLAMMQTLGLTATLEINEDGTAVMDLFGEKEALFFDFGEERVRSDNDSWLDFTWEDGVLTIGNEEGFFRFVKGELEVSAARGPFRLYQLTEMVNVEG